MAVDAVASVVLQKLRDLLLESSSFAKNKVIGRQLEQMQEALEAMRGFFIDAANKETNAEEIKKWTNKYLKHLHYVEDSIESFALRITRQRKRLGLLMNHALFLRKFTACKMLSRKLKRIQRAINELNDRRPNGLEDASLRRGHPQQIKSCLGPVDENGGAEADGPRSTMRRANASPTVSTGQGSPGGSLLEYSFNKLSRCDAPIIIRHQETEREEVDYDGNGVEGDMIKSMFPPVFPPVDPGLIDGRRSNMRRTNSSPMLPVTEGDPRRLNSDHLFKMLRRSDDSLIRERVQQSRLMYSYSYNEEELSIIGYERRVNELWNRLSDPDDWITSVVGQLGSGKTMLARAVYGNRKIKEHFKPAWVTIFKESEKKDILENLLKQVQKSKEQDAGISQDPLEKRVSEELKAQKYLIVLDGVRSLDQWRSIKVAFPNPKNGSKIILTTCDKQVAVLADSKMQPHIMGMLRRRESWALFLKKVGLEEVDEVSAKDRIIEVCQGLPLNIVLLGSLLSTKDREKWTETLDSHETSDMVMLSYNDLDAHLKLCLLYMMLFPKELDIPVRRLQRLWLAEGFVKQPENPDEFQEDVAQDYFKNLVKRSLIMVTKQRSDGSPRKCRLLGVLHDNLSANARDISLFHVHCGPGCRKDGELYKRRFIEYADGKSCSFRSSEYRRLRSYISFNYQKKDTPAKYVATLVSHTIGKGYGLLRVLDLEGVYKPSLPDNLGDLFHLKYLGLRWTFLDKLPQSVGQLPCLETLDLKHTFINRIPPSIWKLKHLRHLNLHEVHLDKDTPLHLRNSLPKLLTLWGLSVNHDSPVKNGLSSFTDLRELGISFRFSKRDDGTSEGSTSTLPTQFTDLVDWISELTALRSLRLRSRDDSGCPAHLSLKSFSRLQKLSHVNLLGKLQELPQLADFPPHVKVLTLSVSHLREDPMPILGRLPELTVLRLLANSYLDEKIVCPSGTFRKLEVLKLWMLDNLNEWVVEGDAMEQLKELNIRCCSKLKNIPSVLWQRTKFRDLILNNMPLEFNSNVDKINKLCGKLSITVKNYEF